MTTVVLPMSPIPFGAYLDCAESVLRAVMPMAPGSILTRHKHALTLHIPLDGDFRRVALLVDTKFVDGQLHMRPRFTMDVPPVSVEDTDGIVRAVSVAAGIISTLKSTFKDATIVV